MATGDIYGIDPQYMKIIPNTDMDSLAYVAMTNAAPNTGNTLKIGDVELDEDDLKILKGIIDKVRPKKVTVGDYDSNDIEKAVREAVEMLR